MMTVCDEVHAAIQRMAEGADAHPVHRAMARSVSGGKLIRPRLLLLAAGDRGPRQAVVAASVAVELLHAALLIHDDVIDGDHERRGVPTTASRAAADGLARGLNQASAQRLGLTTAIVTGDALIVRAMASLARLDVSGDMRNRIADIVERAMLHAASGEYDDVAFAGSIPDTETIDRILHGKTADYSFRAPLEIGAVLAERPGPVVDELGRIGLLMGIVYQLRDDVLGVFGDPVDTGKSSLSDIRAGAPTLLVALASRHELWPSVAERYGYSAADEGDAARIRSVMRASGALDAVEARIRRLCDEARDRLEGLAVEAALREELAAFILRCAERTR